VFAPLGTTDLGGYVNTSSSPFNQAEDRRGLFNRTVWGSNVRVNWNFDAFSLASVTDYLKMQKRYGEDSDISPNPLFNYDTEAHYQQFSQEFRLTGKTGDLRWIGGAYYLNYKTTNFEQTTLPDFIPPVPFPYATGSPTSIFERVRRPRSDSWSTALPITGSDPGRALHHRSEAVPVQLQLQRVRTAGAERAPGGFPFNITYSTATGYPDAEKTYRMPMARRNSNYKIDQIICCTAASTAAPREAAGRHRVPAT